MGFLSGLVNDMLRESTGYDMRKVTRLAGGKNTLMMGAGAALAGGVFAALQGQQAGQGQATTSAANWDAPTGPGTAPPAAPPAAPPSVPTAAAQQTQQAPANLPTPPPNLPTPLNLPTPTAAPPPSLPPLPGAAPQAAAAAPPLPATPSAGTPPALPTPDTTPLPDADVAADDEPELPPEITFAIVRSMVAAALADGHLDEDEKRLVLERLEESNLDLEQKERVHRDLALPPTPADLAAMASEGPQREAMYRLAGLIILADGKVSDLERSWLDRLANAFGFDEARKAGLEGEIFA